MQLTDFKGGAQDAHLHGGTQQICDRIAAELGDDVLLGSPATALRHDANGVSVKVGRRRIKAEKAIVAVSPAVAARIEFEPGLPSREALGQRMPMGAYMKGVAIYDHAWWRDRGLSGIALSDRGPVQMTVDASPSGGSPGVLIGFVTGAPARAVAELEPDARRHVVLEAMAAVTAPEAAQPAQLPGLQLARGALEPRRAGGIDGAGDTDRARPGLAAAGRLAPLGRH